MHFFCCSQTNFHFCCLVGFYPILYQLQRKRAKQGQICPLSGPLGSWGHSNWSQAFLVSTFHQMSITKKRIKGTDSMRLVLRLRWDSIETGMRLQWDSNVTSMRLRWDFDETSMKLRWDSNETPMRLHWDWNETTMRLQWDSEASGTKTQTRRLKDSSCCILPNLALL